MASTKQVERDPRSAPTALWLLAGALFVLLSIISLEALYYYSTNLEQAQKAERASARALQLKEAQLGRLEGYGWLYQEVEDKQVLTFQVPIDRAMELIVKDAKSNPN